MSTNASSFIPVIILTHAINWRWPGLGNAKNLKEMERDVIL